MLFYLSVCALIFAVVLLAVAWWAVHRVPRLALSECCALVTGGSTGIGYEIARHLVHRGTKVVAITARRADVLQSAAEALAKEAGPHTRVLYQTMDVGNAESVRRGLEELRRRAGGDFVVDLAVCNAGFAIASRFVDTSVEEGHRMMDVNFFGCVNVVQEVLPSMLSRRKGRIVLVSSLAARAPIAGYAMYAASKAAVRAFAHSLDMENSCRGVRCQVVSPPDVETPGLREENIRKSPECHAISAFGGATAFSAEAMGKRVVDDIVRYRFDVCLGTDGILLGWGSAGMEPATSVADLIAQTLLGGWLRLVLAVFSKIHYGIVQQCEGPEEVWIALMPYFFRFPSRRVCIAAAIAGGTFSIVLFGDSALRSIRRGQIPLFNPNDIVRVEEHARYPCKVFTGYEVVVKNYYLRTASVSAETSPSPLRRLSALFSNNLNNVVEQADPSAAENQLTLVREVVPHTPAIIAGDEDAKSPPRRQNKSKETIRETETETETEFSRGSLAPPSAPLIASALWPAGTAKYAALTIEPTDAALRERGALRALADRATHQSLVRCDPFGPAPVNCRADATHLCAPYLRVMLSALLLLPLPLPRVRVAVLGVGGGSLPAFVQRHFLRDVARLDLVDAEPLCFEAAVADLGTPIDTAAVAYHVCDAAEFLRDTVSEGTTGTLVRLDSGVGSVGSVVGSVGEGLCLDRHRIVPTAHVHRCRYDVMFVDLFVGSEAPAFVSSGQFLQLCRGALSPIGVAAFNLPAADTAFLDRCRCVFGDGNVFQIPVPASANVTVLARRADEEVATMSRRHFYRRAMSLQKMYALPYDLAAHYPISWRF